MRSNPISTGILIKRITLSLFFLLLFNSSALPADNPGGFYPAGKKELLSYLDKLIPKDNHSAQSNNDNKVSMLLVPHAGYEFSGKIAACAYRLLRKGDYKTVILIGPSHFYSFSGAALSENDYFSTPLGRILLDKDLCAILASEADIRYLPQAFVNEHAIQVQLPFLQKIFSDNPSVSRDAPLDCKIVPILLGDCSLESCRSLAAAIAKACYGRNDVLVIISSDLYHGYDRRQCEISDRETGFLLESGEGESLYRALNEGRAQMCGGFAAVTGLFLSSRFSGVTAKMLCHGDSFTSAGRQDPGDWKVGYGSYAWYYRQDQLKSEGDMLNPGQKRELLKIARDSITDYLATGKKRDLKVEDKLLQENRGAFVTLRINGALRGCIGTMTARQPLYAAVGAMSLEAAFSDPRFGPLTAEELAAVEIEISVLSPLRKISSVEQIELGRHGVLLKKGFNSGVFLPQVAVETGWSREEFLSNLCAHKAGIDAAAWKDKDTQIYVFTATVFSEKEIQPR